MASIGHFMQRIFGKFIGSERTTAGLDSGQALIKVISLSVQGGAIKVEHACLLDRRGEGFVDQEDFLGHVHPWLIEAGLGEAEVVIGLPQYLTTVQVADFPPNSQDALEEMVAIQTRQLAELFEDNFVYDYCRMPASAERPMPVLIGVCLENAVKERVEEYSGTGLRIADFAMNGVAMANSYFHLHPEHADTSSPRLLLDIGVESTILVAVCGGQVLFAGALMFGSDSLTRAMAAKWQVPVDEVVRGLGKYRIPTAGGNDPVLAAVQVLENEIRTALEQWREQDAHEVVRLNLGHIHLAGGGALVPGLPEFLERVFTCPCTLLRPPVPAAYSDLAPVFVAAYGLALQAVGQADLPTSLAPVKVKTAAIRRRRSNVLVAGLTMLTLFLLISLVGTWMRLTQARTELVAQEQQLTQCESVIRQLDQSLAHLAGLEEVQIPLLEYGNRSRRFARSVQELSMARGENDWFIYLGDSQSFEQAKVSQAPESARAPVRAASPGMLFTPLMAGAKEAAETANPVAARRRLVDMEPLEYMVAAGYTTLRSEEPYQPVRDIVSTLNQHQFFMEVDLLSAGQAREDIFAPWRPVLLDGQAAKGIKSMRFKPFSLRMPFAAMDITKPEMRDLPE